MTAFYKTDESDALGRIREQALRLVVPNLDGLIGLLMERQSTLQARDDELVQEQNTISEDGFAAAVRLMMSGDESSPLLEQVPYPYGRSLPHVKQGNDDEHK